MVRFSCLALPGVWSIEERTGCLHVLNSVNLLNSFLGFLRVTQARSFFAMQHADINYTYNMCFFHIARGVGVYRMSFFTPTVSQSHPVLLYTVCQIKTYGTYCSTYFHIFSLISSTIFTLHVLYTPPKDIFFCTKPGQQTKKDRKSVV